MIRRNLRFSNVILVWLFWASSIIAGPKDPVEGAPFENYRQSQNLELQNALRAALPEKNGYVIAGPLDPNVSNPKFAPYFHSVRVICSNLDNQAGSLKLLTSQPTLSVMNSQTYIEYPDSKDFPGYRGIIAALNFNGKETSIEFLTIQQIRFLLWAKDGLFPNDTSIKKGEFQKYAKAVSDYLYEIDKGNLAAPEPKAKDFGLPDSDDPYAPAPPYVIEGYQNYKDFLFSHSEVTTDFASGILGFIPTKETIGKLKTEAPSKAFPNKEAPLFQDELKKFFQRGGQMSNLRTLTKEVFDSLQPGEYFFAVGMNGTIRFGREFTREDVAKIEHTGQKPPRANHSFLFPGEPILTAGAFFIGCDGAGKLARVNTQSGHYFYSNVSATIREDIAERSDQYFLTIGHFFNTLDSLGIVYSDVVVCKL